MISREMLYRKKCSRTLTTFLECTLMQYYTYIIAIKDAGKPLHVILHLKPLQAFM